MGNVVLKHFLFILFLEIEKARTNKIFWYEWQTIYLVPLGLQLTTVCGSVNLCRQFTTEN